MAELNTSLPSWITSRQWTKEETGVGQRFLQGMQVGANLSHQKRAEEAQLKALDLRTRIFDAQQQAKTQSAEGMTALAEVLSEIGSTGAWTDPTARAKFWDTARRYPQTMRDPAFKELTQVFDSADEAKLKMDLANKERQFAPGPLQKDIEYYKGLVAEGADQQYIDLTKSILESKAQKSGFSVRFNPDGTVSEILQGPQSGQSSAPTTTFKTRLQEQLHNFSGAMELIGTMKNNMTEADFGLRGVARDLKVKLAPLLGVDVSGEDLTVRKTIPLLRAALYKNLRSDSNITDSERKQIEKALPTENWLESRKDAEESLKVITSYLRDRARRMSQELGVPAPIYSLSAEEIAQQWQDGKISQADAESAIRQYYPEVLK